MLGIPKFAMSARGWSSALPLFGSPTVCLMRSVEGLRASDRSIINRQLLSRIVCMTATATAALECLAHAFATVGTLAGIVVRVTIRTMYRLAATIVGGTWGLIYGGAITFNITVWIRRIIINVVLFGRGIRVAAEHWLERGVLARDHLYLGAQLWAYSLRTDRVLRQYFNFAIAKHHMLQSFSCAKFTLSNVITGVVNPDHSVQQCKEFKLGKSLPSMPLSTRIGEFVWRHWKKAAFLVVVGKAIHHYRSNGYTDPQQWTVDVSHSTATFVSTKLSAFFTLVGDLPYDIATLAKTLTYYLEESIEHMRYERERWENEQRV